VMVAHADAFVAQFLPVISKYLSANVDAYAEIAAQALHIANGLLNPVAKS
jgi:hypothetical protein